MAELRKLGETLENHGWLQGAVVTNPHARLIARNASNIVEVDIDNLLDEDFVLIVATQSCSIANNDLVLGPNVEFSIGRPIDKLDGNCTFNKHSRKLHTSYQEALDNGAKLSHIEILAKESIFISKAALVDLGATYDENITLGYSELESYIAWLASSYNKPALPTEFNNRLVAADKKDKRKVLAKKLNPFLSGIYVEITPFKELPADEHYNVNLLGLLPVIQGNAIGEATKSMEAFADLMRSSTMNVQLIVTTEDKISVARMRTFKRFYYDDLSHRDIDHPSPPETL